MATISRQPSYAQGVNLTGLMLGTILRKTAPIGNPSSSDVVRRLEKYLHVRTVIVGYNG